MRFHSACRDPLIDENIVFITGITRSGTTMLARLAGSLSGAEYEFEPWIMGQLSVLYGAGNLNFATYSELLRGFVYETFYNHVLGRGLNLRPSDDSCVTNRQPEKLLKFKWERLRNRDDAVKYAEEKGVKLILKMPNMQEFCPALLKIFPRIRIIHIVRHPFDVANSIYRKRWLCDANFANPRMTFIRKAVKFKGKSIYLPWWVEDSTADGFMRADEYSRGLIYWSIFMAKNEKMSKSLKSAQKRQFYEFKYEDFLSAPDSMMKRTADFIGIGYGSMTRAILKEVQQDKSCAGQPAAPISLDASSAKNLSRLMQAKGYSGAISVSLKAGNDRGYSVT